VPKVSPMQTSFGGGEFSPLLNGQVDLDRYKQALEKCLNYIPSLQGGLVRRSGTKFVAATKTAASKARLIPFEFSTTQAYILEFGASYIRFYRNNGQIQSGGSPYEIVSPYAAADLFQLRITQSADVMYITHPSYAPRTLSRTGHTSWTLAVIDFQDGPYLPINTSVTSLTPSAATGAITLTASSIAGLNDGVGFKSTDVGRLIRLREGSVWGWVKITGFTSTTVVSATVLSTLTNTTAKTFFRMGVWSDSSGWPAVVTFHEDRLFFAGATSNPQRLDASCSSDYANFKPSETDGTVNSSNALSFTFNANDVNVVRWIISDEKGLLVGTAGGEWLVRPSSSGEALTPSNITAKRSTKYGSANVLAVQFGKSVLFVQKAGRKVRELTYVFEADGFRAQDLSLLAEHITKTGIVEMADQSEPQPILWCVRNDGYLAALTYERDVDSLKVGWHRHLLGGSSDASGSPSIAESVAVIPSADGTRDELWVLVQRYVNGAVVRHVEYLTPIFDDTIEQKDAFFVDAGLTYDSPVTITAITRNAQCMVTAAAHGFSNGDKVLLSDILGLLNEVDPDLDLEEQTSPLNGMSVLVSDSAANTFKIKDLDGDYIDTSAFETPYASGGEVRKYVSVISGMDHLEGETVSILADGAVQPDQEVVSGDINLDVRATTVQIGYGYRSDGKMLRLNAGAADGTAIGKSQRTHRVGIMLHRSLGLKIGPAFSDLTELTFRKTSDKMSRAPELFTGILSEEFEGDYDFENQFCFRQDQPLPSMVLALMPQMVTQDR
jgi:hypothetical protein